LIIASAPVQVTAMQYSSDMRIKKEIESVDEDDLLQRIKQINVRSYRYTEEWLKVRDDIPDGRVRGVIAQELAKVFPEYVTTIPEYRLEDKNFTIKDFHQIDKTSLIFDTVGALQALESRFSVGEANSVQTSDLKISSSDESSKASGSISIMSGKSSLSSGDVSISTGLSVQGKSGDIEISGGDLLVSSVSGSIKSSFLLQIFNQVMCRMVLVEMLISRLKN